MIKDCELGLDNCSTLTGSSTYTSCQMSSEDIVNTHDTFMKSFGIELSDDDKRLPHLDWIPKLHKYLVKHRLIAGSSECTAKQLSSLFKTGCHYTLIFLSWAASGN